MAEIIYKSLSSLSPVELKYEYFREEALQGNTITYQDGLSFYELRGLKNFQDVTINRGSVLVLTSPIKLSEIFQSTNEVKLGKLPGSFQLQPRDFFDYYVVYRDRTNSFTLLPQAPSIFSVQPINGTNEVELFVDNKYVQVESEYPYKVYLSDRSLDFKQINRQRFEIVYQNDFITIKTKTNTGHRYLAFNNDNVLRAVGVILNNTSVNDYVFKCTPISQSVLNQGFTSTNDWVTYYFDVEDGSKNKTVTINKTFTSVPTNLLINFSANTGAKEGIANINIANLKTALTPSGGPAPIENSYNKEVITTN